MIRAHPHLRSLPRPPSTRRTTLSPPSRWAHITLLVIFLLLSLGSPQSHSTTLTPPIQPAADENAGYERYASATSDSSNAQHLESSNPHSEGSDPIPRAMDDETTLEEYKPLSEKYGISPSTNVPSSHLSSVQNLAAKGHAESCYFLGLFYLYGLAGLSKSALQASVWFRKAAQEGHADGQCALGVLLYYGAEGVTRDTSAAVYYLKAAYSQDSPHGAWLLGRAFYDGRADGGAPNFIEAARLFGLSENPAAVHHLAIMYEYGLIPGPDDDGEGEPPYGSPYEPSPTKAYELYSEAYEKDVLDAGYHLGLLKAYGRGTNQDFTRALEIFRQLATKGHGPGQRYLAIFLVNGHGCDVDYPRGLEWFEACARSGDHRVEKECEVEAGEVRRLLEVAAEQEEKMSEMLEL